MPRNIRSDIFGLDIENIELLILNIENIMYFSTYILIVWFSRKTIMINVVEGRRPE